MALGTSAFGITHIRRKSKNWLTGLVLFHHFPAFKASVFCRRFSKVLEANASHNLSFVNTSYEFAKTAF